MLKLPPPLFFLSLKRFVFIADCLNKAVMEKAFPLPVHSKMFIYLIIGRWKLWIAFLFHSTFLPLSVVSDETLRLISDFTRVLTLLANLLCPSEICVIALITLRLCLLTSSEHVSTSSYCTLS